METLGLFFFGKEKFMKQPKKLTRSQKEILSKKGYDWTKYMFDSEDSICMYFVEKVTNETVALIME